MPATSERIWQAMRDDGALSPESKLELQRNFWLGACDLRWKALGREPNADDVEAVTWAVYQRGLKVSGVEYIEAIAAAHAAGRKDQGQFS